MYEWTIKVKKILSSPTGDDFSHCQIENLELEKKDMVISSDDIICFDIAKRVFPKISTDYYVENGFLMLNGKIVSDFKDLSDNFHSSPCVRILGFTDIFVLILTGKYGDYRAYAYHPYAPKGANFRSITEYFSIDTYCTCLSANQDYQCVVSLRSHWCDEANWYYWEE